MTARLFLPTALLLATGCASSSSPPAQTREGPECQAGQYILGDACATLTIGGPPRTEEAADDAAEADAADAVAEADAADAAAEADAAVDDAAESGAADP